MKTITLLLFLLSPFLLFAQIPKHAISLENQDIGIYLQKQVKPIISGRVLNSEKETMPVTYSLVTPFADLQSKNILYTNEDGTFDIELENAFPYQQLWISIDTFFYTGIMIQSDVKIEVDARYLIENGGGQFIGEGIAYTGTDGALNTYLNNHLVFQREENKVVQRAYRKLKRNRAIPFKDFKVEYDSLYQILFDRDLEFSKKYPSEYFWIIKNERMSDYYSNILVMHWGKKNMDEAIWKEIKKHQSYFVSNEGMSFYNYLLTYCESKNYLEYKPEWERFKNYSKITKEGLALIDTLSHYDSLIANKEIFDSKAGLKLMGKARIFFKDTINEINTKATLAFLDQQFKPSEADLLKMKFDNEDIKTEQRIFDLVFETMQTDWCESMLKTAYQNNKIKIKEINKTLSESSSIKQEKNIGIPIGAFSFDARLYHIQEGSGDEFLKSLKKSFEGKALLIDFWATWCGPCISEMPHSKKLHKAASDLPVEFIYLCTSSGSDFEKWKSKVVEMKQPGTHIFVDHAIINELMSAFSLSGYPSYALINKKGEYKPGIHRISNIPKKKLEEMIE